MKSVREASETIRIFIGSSAKNRVEEKVFVSTLRRYASVPLEINIIDGDTNSLRMQSGETKTLPSEMSGGVSRVTAFSLARFAIPEWCGFEGRAIYCDSDQLVFTDIAELWNTDLRGATIAAVPVAKAICAPPYWRSFLDGVSSASAGYFLTSVMLLDCRAAGAWDIREISRQLNCGQLDYTELMFVGHEFQERFRTTAQALPAEWNSLDLVTAECKLLHFTDLSTQPWLFPHNPAQTVWEQHFFAALDRGELTRDDLVVARSLRGISLRTFVSPHLPRVLRGSVNTLWRGLERLSPFQLGGVLLRLLNEQLVPRHAWSFGKRASFTKNARLALSMLPVHVAARWTLRRPEVVGVISSLTCERMLVPVLCELAAQARDRGIRVTAVVPSLRAVSSGLERRLREAGCRIDRSGISLLRACLSPARSVALLCLDYGKYYRHHKTGVNIAETLDRYGVSTICLQHGGCRADSVEGLATSASRTLLVWGQSTRRMLIEDHAISPGRIRIVGNHLHDRLPSLRADAIRQNMARLHPEFWRRVGDRRLILLATTIQREYAEWPDEQERYVRYLEHFYKSVDFSRAVVIVRAHPYDLRGNRNLYEELIPAPVRKSVLVLSHEQEPDTYSMLRTADLVVTRCSTVAEEALLLGKKVVAFDLDEDGPSRDYRHLLQFGDYRVAYAEPFETLGRTIRDTLDADACAAAHRDIVSELTRALDGHSMGCTVEAIVGELQAATADGATR